MSGLFKRLSSRRSAGPEGSQPQQAGEPGAADVSASNPAEPEARPSLLTDPAGPTRVLREGEQPAGPTPDDPRPAEPALSEPAVGAAPMADAGPGAGDGDAPAPFGPHPAGAEPNPFAPPPFGPQPAPYLAPPAVASADLPAGLDPDELAAAPATSARRGKLRRRVAFLRAARELLLRDLGGFVYELHRTAHDIEADAHRRLRETKLGRLERVDAELHELEMLLDDVRRQVLVREPGVGGECSQCGELYGSSAHFCSNCGLPLTEAARRELAKAHRPVAADQPTQEIGPPAQNAEFRWPARSDASTPVGEGKPATTGPAAVDDAQAGKGEEPRSGDVMAGEGPRRDDAAPGDDVAAPRDDAAPGDDVAARRDDAAPGDDVAARRDDAAPGEEQPAQH